MDLETQINNSPSDFEAGTILFLKPVDFTQKPFIDVDFAMLTSAETYNMVQHIALKIVSRDNDYYIDQDFYNKFEEDDKLQFGRIYEVSNVITNQMKGTFEYDYVSIKDDLQIEVVDEELIDGFINL